MKSKVKLLIKAVKTLLISSVGALAITVYAAAASSSVNQSFDFGYEVGGDSATIPLQVFDDGKRTYFQFREQLKLLPIIFRIGTNGEREQMPFERRAPYVIVSDISKRFYLSNGVGQASVEYVGARTTDTTKPISFDEAVAKVVAAIQPADSSPIKSPVQIALAPVVRVAPTSMTDLRTVYRDLAFAPQSASLNAPAEIILESILPEINNASGIVVYGRNDRGGNAKLAHLRGAAIREWMFKRNVYPNIVTVIADPEVRPDVEGKGFLSSVFITVKPSLTTTSNAQASVVAMATPMPLSVGSLAKKSMPQPEPSSNPNVLAATTELLQKGLISPEMATQVLMRLRDSTKTEGYRIWESRPSDRDVKNVMDAWVKQAGWAELVWEVRVCPAPDLTFAGSFEQAVGKVTASLGLVAELYTVDRVLVIKESSAGARCNKGTS